MTLRKQIINEDGTSEIFHLTDEEVAEAEAEAEKLRPIIEKQLVEMAQQSAARKLILEKLGITEEEAKLLLG